MRRKAEDNIHVNDDYASAEIRPGLEAGLSPPEWSALLRNIYALAD
jgi:hypothetical protein